jgi:hypothetical protein
LFAKKKASLSAAEFALFRACKEGRLDDVVAALDAGARVDARGPEKETPLMVASFNGWAAIVRFLSSRGADVNLTDKWRGSPLHLAAFHGHRDVVFTLLALKANPELRNAKGQAPWAVAAVDDIAAVLRKFKPSNGRTLMHFACETESLGLVQWLIACRFGNIVVAWDSAITAPLHIAAEKGNLPICTALLLAGADRHIYDGKRRQPIDLAKTEDVRQLLETFEPHRVASERVGSPGAASSVAAVSSAADPFDEFVTARLTRKGSSSLVDRQDSAPASPVPGADAISAEQMYEAYGSQSYSAASAADRSSARVATRGSWSPATGAKLFDPFAASATPVAAASPALADGDDDRPRQPTRASSASAFAGAAPAAAVPSKATRLAWSPFDN